MTGVRDKLLTGSDAWSREARQVSRLAAEAGAPLDEDELILLDVRDLQGMAERLRQGARAPGRLWATVRQIVRVAALGA